MPRLPGVYPVIGDGGLGLVAPSGEGQRVIVGVSSSGDLNTLVSLADVQSARTILGYGPLADAAADQLALGGGTVNVVRVPGSVAGAVTPTIANPASPAVALTGTSNRQLDLVVSITKAGAVGTAQFTYSLDGGDTVVGPIATAASYAVPGTAHTLTFAAGAYVLGAYRFSVTAPTASVADIQAGIRVAFNSPALFEYVHVAQPADNSVWAAYDALATEAEVNFRYVFILAEAPGLLSTESVDDWVTRLEAMHSAFSSKRVLIVAPYAEVIDVLDGTQPTRNLASRLGARLSSTAPHINPGWVQLGPVSSLITVAPFTVGTFGKASSFNGGHALRLEQAGYSTVYQLQGRQGWFWTDGRMAAAPTSDFLTVTNRRVMDKGLTQVRQSLLDFVNKGVDPTDLDASLADMIARARAPLRQMQANGEIAGHNVVIPPGQNILSTRQLLVQVRIIPLGYLREITLDIAFQNPYLVAV